MTQSTRIELDQYIANLCTFVINSTDNHISLAWMNNHGIQLVMGLNLKYNFNFFAGRHELLKINGRWIDINLN